MAVVVVRADADDGDLGVHGGEELRREVGRPVVGHLQHVGPDVRPGGEQILLGLDLGVTGQQDPDAADLGPQDQRRVVRVRMGVVVRPARSQDVQVHGADVQVGARRRAEDRESQLGRHPVDDHRPRVRGVEWPGEQPPDPPAAHQPGQAADVIEVEVGQHEQRHLVDVQTTQAAIEDDRIGSGVDHDRGARPGRQQQGIALADVAGQEQPARGRPGRGRRPHREGDHESGRGGGPEHPPRSGPGRDEADDHRDAEEEQAAGRAARPRQDGAGESAEVVGDADQPAAGPAGQPGQRRAPRQPERSEQGGPEAEHGDDRDDRLGEHVGRDRDETDLAGDRRDDRRRHQVRGGGHRDRLGHQQRDPAAVQGPSPPGRDQQ